MLFRASRLIVLVTFLFVAVSVHAERPSKLATTMAQKTNQEVKALFVVGPDDEVKELNYTYIFDNFALGILSKEKPKEKGRDLSQPDQKKVLERVKLVFDEAEARVDALGLASKKAELKEEIEDIRKSINRTLSMPFKGYGEEAGVFNALMPTVIVENKNFAVVIDKMLVTATDEEKKILEAAFK